MTDFQLVHDRCRHSPLANEDILPCKQTWNWYNIFAFWMSDVHSAGGYVFAGTLFSLGLTGWQVFVSLLAGIVIVQIFANAIGIISQRNAVPFPVVARMTYGVYGSNIPALIRGIIAIVWYGIQTYLASAALMVTMMYFFPDLKVYATESILGLSILGWWCFFAMWLAQTALFLCRMEAIRKFIDFAGPAVYVVMVVMMFYILYEAGWDNISFTLGEKELTTSEVIWNMAIAISLIVSYFAGPTLNYGDFSRYCKTPREMRRGNFWGLPVNFVFFSGVAVITISGTPAVFGEIIINPIDVMGHLDNKWIIVLISFTLLTATVGVNIVANFVSAAFDISNVFPKVITWRRGGMIAAVISVAILPWNLFNSPDVIHRTIDLLAGFIGPLYGILIVDYYLVKARHVDVYALFSVAKGDTYWYSGGVNLKAVYALVPAGLCAISTLVIEALNPLSNFSFVIGALLGALIYYGLAAKKAS